MLALNLVFFTKIVFAPVNLFGDKLSYFLSSLVSPQVWCFRTEISIINILIQLSLYTTHKTFLTDLKCSCCEISGFAIWNLSMGIVIFQRKN
jgi:hypothetical protein